MKSMLLCTVPRFLLGLIFLVGAIDGFALIFTGSNLIHLPMSEKGRTFVTSLHSMVFLFPMVKTIELVGSLCLLSNRAPALGLALLAPIMSVIVVFQFLLNPPGVPTALILVISGGLLALRYRKNFAYLASDPQPHNEQFVRTRQRPDRHSSSV
ncbi:hypothetical protein [Burkholderia sp. MSMB1835]|uniref:hypothetical protein n=1 Tax=Burkholderia sp. MSMB1835 TaxID=1637876 RepID=UPI000AD1BB3C|nr:hypothetical protein [Burkholderia sp. MSMB1835]